MPFNFKEKRQEEYKFLIRISDMVERVDGADAGSLDGYASILSLNFHHWIEGKKITI